MARKRRPPRSVVFLTPEQRRQQEFARQRAAARARSESFGFGPAPLSLPKHEPARPPLKPKTTRTGIVVDPRGRTVGSLPVKAKVKVKREPPAKRKGLSTIDTVPRDRKQPTPRKPTSLAEPTVDQKARKQAVPADSRLARFDKRAKPSPKPKTRTTTRGAPPAVLTYDALNRLPTAEELAKAEYAPAFTGYDLEAKQDTLAAEERRRAVEGFTLALMRELGGLSAGVAGDYSAAAQATQGVAAAAADQLRGAGTQANERLQADLSAIGAPAEQASQARQALLDVFAGGAGAQYYTEGAMPTEGLIGEGARQTAFTRQLPAFAALSGQQNFRQALYEAEQERQELSGRRAATLREMGARVPYYELQLASEEARRQEAATEAEIKRQAAATNAQLAAATFGLKVQNQGFQQGATTQRLANDQTSLRLQAIQSDRSWNATLRRLGQTDSRLKLDYAKAEAAYQRRGKSGGLTSYQVQRLASETADRAADFYNGVQDADGNVIQEPLATQPNGYQLAMADLLSRGVPLTLAQRALNRWWRTPGRFGRPKVPFQLRTKRK